LTTAQEGAKPLWLIFAVSIIGMTGVQSFLPALPLMQDELGLSNAETSLVVTVYLFPGIVMALPAGLLADRFGRRVVLATGLFTLGIGGVALTFAHSFTAVLAVRFIQGFGFATFAPLTITLLGDWFTGVRHVQAQAYRTVAMSVGSAVLPIAGGLLAGISWYSSFALQSIAIVAGVAVMWLVPYEAAARNPVTRNLRSLARLANDRTVVATQAMAIMRFFLLFGFIAYFPILLADRFGLSSVAIGVLLGAVFGASSVTGALTTRFLRSITPSGLMALSLLLAGGSLALVGLAQHLSLAILGGLIFAASDGPLGVLHNTVSAHITPLEIRASFVAATGATKNFGKFLGPAFAGLALTVVPLSLTFVALGFTAGASVFIPRVFRPLDSTLSGQSADPGATP
jgi:ACDE family multidrug resistance protein